MGVHGLWQLLQPAGRPVSLESLEGKVLAVDVSIWLYQTMKGMRDKDGNPLPNAHLQGLFSRVCKLLFYRIKPVFVFDGGVPVLKKKTMAARRDRRAEAERESSAVAEKLLENLVKSQAVKQALGDAGHRVPSGSKPGRVPGVRKGRNQKDEDIFELAPLPESEEINLIKEAEEWERDFEQQENWIKEGLAALSDTHPDADEFKSLPSEIQHEILRELKERKKYHTLSHLTKMPEDSEDFSSYQLKRLMKQCRLTTRIEEIRKEMTNQTAQDITAQFVGEECGAVKTQFGDQVEARRIVSEDASHYVLIKGISSEGQLKQADKYHLEQTVKVEDVDCDTETQPLNGGGGNDGSNTSPDKPKKSSLKILSTDESDSDIETVVARRMRRKGSGRGRGGKRRRIGPERGKITAAMKVKEEGSGLRQGKKERAVVETSSSSEDEGFIEVTVDPDASIEEDELFPASIFEMVGARNSSSAKEVQLKPEGQLNRKERFDSAEDAASLKATRNSSLAGRLEPSPTKVNSKEVLAMVSEEKRREVVEASTAAAKRKSVLTDILGQLQEKKKKLQEEVVGVDAGDNPSPREVNEDVDLEEVVGRDLGKFVSGQTDEEVEAMGGGFIPEELSDEDILADSKKRELLGAAAAGSSDEASARKLLSQETGRGGQATSPDSDSDEELKLARQLSLQTEAANRNSRQDQDTELDEDLRLAIKLSLEVTRSGEDDGSRSLVSSRLRSKSVGSSSKSDDDSDGFEDSAEIGSFSREEMENELREDTARQRAGPSTLMENDLGDRQQIAESDQDRLQPEDFEVDDTESRSYIPGLTEYDLHDMREELDSERSALMSQQGRQNRMAASVTEQTTQDAQDLLRMFGVPYIVSPLEAEAQCAFLEAAGLTEGTITDDSDFWLFGGQCMYKNFFNQSKHVEIYTMDNIHNHFSLSREQLINIALLCGSDYTEGVQGVGPVRALEIMAEFPGAGLEGLYKFRQWWDRAKTSPGSLVAENKVRARLRNLDLIPGFPSEAVVEAYLNPTVDESTERFSWASPDLDMLRDFCKLKFGWRKERSDRTLVPMYKEWSKTQSQGRISSYFGPEAFVQTSKIRSDRLRRALEMVKNPAAGERTGGKTTGGERGSKQNAGKKKPKKKPAEDEGDGKAEGKAIKNPGNKSGGKRVCFADNVEESSDGQSARMKEEEEERGDDFMQKMSEKVRKAKAEMGKKNQARSFAGVQSTGGKSIEGSGRARGKRRGAGRGGNQVANSIPVSLDVKSRRGRSARGGRTGPSKQAGVVNLSESSSSESNDEDTMVPAVQRGKHVKPRNATEKRQNSARASEKSLRTEEGLAEQTGNSRQKGLKDKGERTPHGKEAKEASVVKQETVEKSKVPSTKVGPDVVNVSVNSATRVLDPVSWKVKDGVQKLRESTQSKRENMKQKDARGKLSTSGNDLPSKPLEKDFSGTRTQEVAEPRSGRKNASGCVGKMEKEKRRIDSSSVMKRRMGTDEPVLAAEAERSLVSKEEEGKAAAARPGSEEDKPVDMSKADVSVINRRNLPATLMYLNQRSKQDRMLLNQISGKRGRNAVELRMEQEERRGLPVVVERVKRKEEDEKSSGEEEAHFSPGLTFEDALDGGGAESGAVLRAKRRKFHSGTQGRSVVEDKHRNTSAGQKSVKTGSEHKSARSVSQGKSLGSSSSDEESSRLKSVQTKGLTGQLNATKALSDGRKKDTSVALKERSAVEKSSGGKHRRVSSGRDKKLVASVIESALSEAVSVNHSTGKALTKTRADSNSFETHLKELDGDHKSSISEEDFDRFISTGQQTNSRTKQKSEEGDLERVKGKSKRSRAFDRPIKAGGSDDDGCARSVRKSFQNQLRHLHEQRSIKGHGPLYTSAPGQNYNPFQDVTARAFVGKGKGRGKNRTAMEDGGGGGGFITQEERAQYENLTVDDLGSDFSDDGF